MHKFFIISLAILLQCTEGFIGGPPCSKDLLIAVLWDGTIVPKIDWTTHPRWEEIQYMPQWPDSFQRIRPKGKVGSSRFPDKVQFNRSSTCYNVKWDIVEYKDNNNLDVIFNAEVRTRLETSNVIVGYYNKAVSKLASDRDISYMITEPLPLTVDPRGEFSQPMANTWLAMWPSWMDVARLVKAYLKAEKKKKVLVLYTADSPTAYEVSQIVNNAISKMPEIQFTSITVIRYPDIPKLPQLPSAEQTRELDSIFRLINEKKVETVLAFFDNKEPMWLLQQFFTEGRTLDRNELSWLLLDQTLTHNSKMTKLEYIRVLRTPIFTIVPSYPARNTREGSCIAYFDETDRLAAQDGMLMLNTVLKEKLAPADFTNRKLYNALKGFVLQPEAYSMDNRIMQQFRNDLVSHVRLGWTLEFDENTHLRKDFEMQIRYLLPDATVYGRQGETCGVVSSVWFSGKVPLGIESSYLPVGGSSEESITRVVAVETSSSPRNGCESTDTTNYLLLITIALKTYLLV